MLGLKLSHHHLKSGQLGGAASDGTLAAGQVLHGLLEDLLGLGASLDLSGKRAYTVNIGLKLSSVTDQDWSRVDQRYEHALTVEILKLQKLLVILRHPCIDLLRSSNTSHYNYIEK